MAEGCSKTPTEARHVAAAQVAPLLKVLKDTVAELAVAVDGRVLVALTRGLWELTAREIHDYLEGLQESYDTKVGRPWLILCMAAPAPGAPALPPARLCHNQVDWRTRRCCWH